MKLIDCKTLHYDAGWRVVAGKAYDTASVLARLRYLRVQRIFSVQNGLLKNEQLASTFGVEKSGCSSIATKSTT
jgi:hypothetical protein